jgi:hypothetical protein
VAEIEQIYKVEKTCIQITNRLIDEETSEAVIEEL